MQITKRTVYWLVLILILITYLLYWFGAKEQPLPERNFSTSQLLIHSLTGWGIYSGPEDWPAHDFYLKGAVGGSVIRFMKPPEGIGQWSLADVNNGLWEQVADMEQWVVKFSTIGYAKQAYREHYWVPDDTRNPFKTSLWQPLEGIEYKSHIADQFRIVCNSNRKLVTSCDIEAQYDEFYVLIRYSSVNEYNDNPIDDLNTIAIAVDARVEKHLSIQE